ncbi:MAG: hypothetical protein WAR78_02360, partial [Ferruginibacter sp.]
MKKLYLYLFLPALFFLHACSSTKRVAAVSDDGMIEITFIQVNDVYEIAPLDGGRSGGMARVATFKKEALLKNPNTYLV